MKDIRDFNLADTARITGINPVTLRRHIDNDWLEAYQDKPGGAWHIDAQEIIDYAFAKWEEGTVTMYPPQNIAKHINSIMEDRKGGRR